MEAEAARKSGRGEGKGLCGGRGEGGINGATLAEEEPTQPAVAAEAPALAVAAEAPALAVAAEAPALAVGAAEGVAAAVEDEAEAGATFK